MRKRKLSSRASGEITEARDSLLSGEELRLWSRAKALVG